MYIPDHDKNVKFDVNKIYLIVTNPFRSGIQQDKKNLGR